MLAGAEGGGGGQIGIAVAGREHTLTAEDLLLTMRAPDGYSVEREGAHAVALDLAIDDDLRREGRAREIVHAVQNARKTAGLQVEDRIELALDGDPALIEAAGAHRDYVAGRDARGRAVCSGDGARPAPAAMDYSEQTEIDGLTLSISCAARSRRPERLRRRERGLQLLLELLLRVGADHRLDRLAALEEDHASGSRAPGSGPRSAGSRRCRA